MVKKSNIKKNSPELDHIFPKSQLRNQGFDEVLVNHFANFWILSMEKNRNKSDKHPKDYFKDVDDKTLENAVIDRKLLDYPNYEAFVKNRSKMLIEKIMTKLQYRKEELGNLYIVKYWILYVKIKWKNGK